MTCARGIPLLACVAGLLWACGGGAPPSREPRALPPADPAAVQKYLEASALMSDGKTLDEQRAAALLQEALVIDPNLWEARYNLGVLHRRRGELRRALREFEAAHDIQPGAPGPRRALAEVHYAMGGLGDAARFLRDHVAAHPEDVESRVALTAVLREQRDYGRALEQARAALVRDPGSVGALIEVGRIYRERGELDVAELVFGRALRLYERDPRPHNELGLTAVERGDTQLAFEHFERAVASDRAFAPARVNRAAVLLRAGDYAAAAEEYRKLLEQDPAHDDAGVGLAVALRAQGKHEQAAAEYERVLSRSPHHGPALFDLALLRAEWLDQKQEARALFERYLQVAGEGPSRSAAERYLEQLAGHVSANGGAR
jgi:tetratricopeptide (TPR) repeat protein